MFDPDVCEACGRDLKAMGMYRDYVHYRADYPDTPCIELSDGMKAVAKELAEEFMKDFRRTMERGW